MNQSVSTPNEPSQFAARTGNPLNDTFDIFADGGDGLTPQAAARCLNKVKRAMSGVAGITRILIANSAADKRDQLGDYLAGTLLTAANTLAEYVEVDLDELADWANRAAEASHA